MIIAKRLKGKAISAWLGPSGDAARRVVTRAKQKIAGTGPRLDVYFDLADPWRYLTCQVVTRLRDAYPVDLSFTVVTPPGTDVAPMPLLQAAHSFRDAQHLAAYWDLEFPGKKEPDAGMVRDVGSALIRARPAREQLACAMELTTTMWKVDKKLLVTQLGTWGTESHGEVLPILNSHYGELRKAGHYQGGMIQFDGTWYNGVDRLPYLEAALAKAFGSAVVGVVKPRPLEQRGPLALSDKPLICDMWFSFRSPYSYLALEQIEAALAPYGVPLALRPIAPMVSRGLPMPTVKKLYLLGDAKREADRLVIPFGEICDPLGAGIDHCIAIMYWALRRSPAEALAFARSAMRGIWSEAKDPGEYIDLRVMVERAGLPWEEAKAALGDPAAARMAFDNAADLNGIGLWGVPSFRIGELVLWGQDRLPLIADRLRRHPPRATP